MFDSLSKVEDGRERQRRLYRLQKRWVIASIDNQCDDSNQNNAAAVQSVRKREKADAFGNQFHDKRQRKEKEKEAKLDCRG